MPSAQQLPSGLRIVKRKCVAVHAPTLRKRPLRASWIDPFLRGDVWLESRGDDQLDLMFEQYRVARIRGTELDVMSLNQLAFALRHRLPRRVRRDPPATRARKIAPAR